MADLDDQPAEMSELDLSEDTAITGEDVQELIGTDEDDSVVKGDPEAEK